MQPRDPSTFWQRMVMGRIQQGLNHGRRATCGKCDGEMVPSQARGGLICLDCDMIISWPTAACAIMDADWAEYNRRESI